ncbi:MAG: coproporphyrinogen III oxidase-like Fe-S oxidoreductase [Sulfitobacter sp.]|jgi:coproporphyrinogen III oxidase-like Fe-S oxidoreductase
MLAPADQASEFLMMGLRLKEGVDLKRYTALAGAPLAKKKIIRMQDIGMINLVKDQLTVTNQGFMVLNAILAELLSD